jgi:hypothetical protein
LIYKFKLPGKRGPNVKVEISFFTGKSQVWVEGKQIESDDKKVYQIPTGKNKSERMRLSPNLFSLGLDIIYKDQRRTVSREVSKLEYITGYAPVILGVFTSSMYDANVYKSGAMGVLSIFFSLLNMRILQSEKAEGAKLIYNGVVLTLSWFVFWMIAKV